MPQIDAQSSTMIDAIKTQAASIADLTKTVSRGVPAMRDASENVLELNPSSTSPLLTSQTNDVGTVYSDGWLMSVDKTGQEWRNFAADTVQAGGGTTFLNTGGVDAPAVTAHDYVQSNNVYASYMQANSLYGDRVSAGASVLDNTTLTAQQVLCEGSGMNYSGVWCGQSSIQPNSVAGPNVYGYDVYADRVHVGNSYVDGGVGFFPQCNGYGAAFGGVGIGGGGINTGNRAVDAFLAPMYAGAFFTNISEERFKRDIIPVADSQLDVVRGAPVYHFRYRRDVPVTSSPAHDGDEEAAAAAAEKWRRGPMADDLPDHVLGDTPRGRAPELGAMLNTAWAAIGELSDKLDAALARIAALEAA